MEEGSFIQLKGTKLDEMKVEGYQGDIKTLSLKAIEEAVEIDKSPISINGIAADAFRGCETLETADLTKANDSLTFEVGKEAFAYCTALKSVSLPDNIFVDNNTIGDYSFRNCTALASISLTEKFSEIGRGSFKSCTNLKSVNLPGSIKRIEEELFSQCNSLSTVKFPNNITSIGESAFESTGLTSLNLDSFKTLKYIGSFAFEGTEITSVNIPDSVTYIGNGAFFNCRKLTSVSVPFLGSSLASTGSWNFDSVYGVVVSSDDDQTLPRSITVNVRATAAIPAGAFSGCADIASINISFTDKLKADIYASDGIAFERVDIATNKKVQSNAFKGCSNLASLTINGSVTGIGNNAFDGCYVLTELPSLSSVRAIGEYAFRNCRSIKEITVPAGVTELGGGAFADCSSLEKLSFESWFFDTAIADGAIESRNFGNLSTYFRSVTTLSTSAAQELLYRANGNGVYLPLSLTEISIGGLNYIPNAYSYGGGMFSGWSALKEVTLDFVKPREEFAESNHGVGDYAFYGCGALEKITIGDKDKVIKYIGNGAFMGCSSLEKITVPASVETLGSNAFRGCSEITSFVFPATVKTCGSGILADCTSLATLEVTTYDKLVTTINDNDGTRSTEYVRIDVNQMFASGSDNLDGKMYYNEYKRVWLPTSLKKVKLGGMTDLADSAFRGWEKLTSVEIDVAQKLEYTGADGEKYIHNPSIGQYAFYGCNALSSVTFTNETKLTQIGSYAFAQCLALEGLTIPANVSVLGNRVFFASGLKSLVLPAALTSVGDALVADCYRLASIEIADYDKVITEITDRGYTTKVYYALSPKNLFASTTELTTEGRNPQMYRSTSQNIYIPSALQSVKLGSVTELENNVFDGWASLKTIEIDFAEKLVIESSGAETKKEAKIGNQAFRNCSKLENLTVKNAAYVKNIGNGAFNGCSSLKKIPFALSLESESGIVGGATSLAEITVVLPTELSAVGISKMFGLSDNTRLPSALKKVTLVASTDSDGNKQPAVIPANMFKNAADITNVVFNATDITEIGSSAFASCGAYPTADTNGTRSYNGWVLSLGSNRIVPANTVGIANGVVSSGSSIYVNGNGASFKYKPAGVNVYLYSENQPTSYGPHWHYESGNIVPWTYPEATYTFVLNNGEENDTRVCSSGVLYNDNTPSPSKESMVLEGWYTESGLTGEKVSFPYYSSTKTTLYAKWIASPYTETNDTQHPFMKSGGTITSSNKQNDSQSTYRITANVNITLSFQYKVSSESNYDKFTITKHSGGISSQLDQISGESNSWQSITVELKAGDYITFTYSKDNSNSNGNDCGYIRSITVRQ